MKHGIFEVSGKFDVFVEDVKIRRCRTEETANEVFTYFEAKAKRAAKHGKNETKQTVQPAVEPAQVVAYTTPVATVTAHQSAYIPESDPAFVPFGEFADINTVIKSREFFPIFISGPTGNGKSTMVEQACAKNKREYIRLQINAQTDEDQLIGSKTLTNGNIEIIEGPVLIAMRRGAVLLLDECDCADANSILTLQSILEGKPYYFKLKNEMVFPAKGFNIIATANTKGRGSESGKYIGTKLLNEAFLERFPVTFEQEYPTESVERKIVHKAMQKFLNEVQPEFADLLVRWSSTIRKAYDEGALDDLITTRRLIQIVHAYSIFKNQKNAIKMACNRFDSVTKATFIETFDKLTPSDIKDVVSTEVPVNEEVTTEAAV